MAFSCDCEEKPEYHVSITSPDVQNINIGDDTHLVLDRTYCVEVYATAPSYAPSDTTRLTILWIDVESEQEDGIVELKSITIQISYSNGFLCLTNVPNSATIEIYNLAGLLLYRTIAENDVANIAMQDQNVVIVKVNDKGIKCKL